ncbi:MAG TPA: hypothetical protein PK760_02765 [Flavobacteriales bacterium]|nr:hypothetical protein [Flavobacteriales bacterium]
MVSAARSVLVLYVLSLAFGIGLCFAPNVIPDDGTIVQWLLVAQLSYPLFWWMTPKQAWTGAWRRLRMAHGIALLLALLVLAFAWLSTPDVSGFSS